MWGRESVRSSQLPAYLTVQRQEHPDTVVSAAPGKSYHRSKSPVTTPAPHIRSTPINYQKSHTRSHYCGSSCPRFISTWGPILGS
jgi:hypothetical protein